MLAFKEKVESLLTPNTDGTVSEDELRYGIISYQLYQKSPAIEAKFQELYRAARSKGTNKDAASEQALCELVTANKLTSSEADWVASLSFRAAQLDGSQQHLASGLGGGSLNLPAALQIAEASLAGIQSGTIKVPPRTLSSADATNTSLSTDPGADMRANAQFIEGTARNGFLWKPISESDGNLVVLLPSSLSGRISSVSVYESGTLTSDNAIEKGRFVGDTNGDRPTFRFGDPGAEYPENATVLVETKNGEFLRFDIENSAVRNN